MATARTTLELLSPARDLGTGIEAIDHGADAVYIGGPQFGARSAAGNSVADIEQLARHAHRFSARVFVTLNTLLKDDELEQAERLIRQVYEAGADALIVQDMGVLQLDLPPIALHASTQTDNRTPEKVRFLEQAGFSQVVLARELTLEQIRAIAAQTSVKLEFFVHGALCVSYSGQCWLSHAHTGRSANRGECAQLCRLPCTLTDPEGHVLARDQHLLSLKDMDQSANLRALVEAGVSSFKIEGRLKDVSYVKNVTAHYRRLMDALLEDVPGYRRGSAGRSRFSFQPQPGKSFNRGATDYFLHGRQQDITSFATPKFAGEPIGRVVRVERQWFEIDGDVAIHNGDGLSYFNGAGELMGLRVNRAEGRRLFPAEAASGLASGTGLFRNRDQEFEKRLEKKSAERRIAVRLRLEEVADGFVLFLEDEEGICAEARLAHPKEAAGNSERAEAAIRDGLGKLGNTLFEAAGIESQLPAPRFIPASALNGLRRDGVAALEAARLASYRRPTPATPAMPPAPYPETRLTYRGNVYNGLARAFYARHGVTAMEPAYECNAEAGEVSLMITRHCLRYSFGLCPKQKKGVRPDPMTLTMGNDLLSLRFDCRACEMHVVGKLKKTSRSR